MAKKRMTIYYIYKCEIAHDMDNFVNEIKKNIESLFVDGRE